MNKKDNIMRGKKLGRVIIRLAPIIAFCTFWLSGCGLDGAYEDGGGPQIHPPQTRILAVRVQPDTVAPGDTTRFVCVITDSTDNRFKFYWLIRYGKVEDAKLVEGGFYDYTSGSSRSIEWIAPGRSDTYDFEVTVDNGSADSAWVKQSFSITVR